MPAPDLIAKGLVDRDFVREGEGPDHLWGYDITEESDPEARCSAVVLDVYSHRVVGWSIDALSTAALVTGALGMAIESPPRRIRSRAAIRLLGVTTARGRLGWCHRWAPADCCDNAVIESVLSWMQVELLGRRLRQTRIELANAIFEYLEIGHAGACHSRLDPLWCVGLAVVRAAETLASLAQPLDAEVADPLVSRRPRDSELLGDLSRGPSCLNPVPRAVGAYGVRRALRCIIEASGVGGGCVRTHLARRPRSTRHAAINHVRGYDN